MLGIDEAGAASITYREIKRRIIDPHYEVGERLSEARLAEDLGVGRSPIRTALLRLKSEGWIDISPQSGTYIKAMTPSEIREVADLRMLLEMRAAGDAATRISDAAILKDLRVEFALVREPRRPPMATQMPSSRWTTVSTPQPTTPPTTRSFATSCSTSRQGAMDPSRVCAVSNERVQDGFRSWSVSCICKRAARRERKRPRPCAIT